MPGKLLNEEIVRHVLHKEWLECIEEDGHAPTAQSLALGAEWQMSQTIMAEIFELAEEFVTQQLTEAQK